MLERHCCKRRAGRGYPFLQSAHQRPYLHRAVDVSARLERGYLFGLCPYPVCPRDDRGRDLSDPPRGRIRSGRRQPSGVPEYLLRDRRLAVYRQI